MPLDPAQSCGFADGAGRSGLDRFLGLLDFPFFTTTTPGCAGAAAFSAAGFSFALFIGDGGAKSSGSPFGKVTALWNDACAVSGSRARLDSGMEWNLLRSARTPHQSSTPTATTKLGTARMPLAIPNRNSLLS